MRGNVMDEMMKEIDTALDECIKKFRNATTGKEVRTFITEYEELMLKKSDEVVKTALKTEKEPDETKIQRDGWQDMREMEVRMKHDSDMKKPALLRDVIKWHMKSLAYTDEANLRANIAIAMSIINAIALFGIILFT